MAGFEGNGEACDACAPGTFNDETGGSSRCLLCPVGYFCPHTNGTEPFECQPGWLSIDFGTSSCAMSYSLPLVPLSCMACIYSLVLYIKPPYRCWMEKRTGPSPCKKKGCGKDCGNLQLFVFMTTKVLHGLQAATLVMGLLISAVVVSPGPWRILVPEVIDGAALLFCLVGFMGTVAITLAGFMGVGSALFCCTCLKEPDISRNADVEIATHGMCDQCTSRAKAVEDQKAADKVRPFQSGSTCTLHRAHLVRSVSYIRD